jgi:hypothetical protein
MKLVLATLLRCAQRWKRVSVSELEDASSISCARSSVPILRPRDRTDKEKGGGHRTNAA